MMSYLALKAVSAGHSLLDYSEQVLSQRYTI